MKQKHFWKLEYSITLLAVFALLILFMPTSIKSTLQAGLIAQWKDCYNNLSYMKDVMDKHEQENMLASLKRSTDKAEREKIITMIIKPYFRLTENKYLKHYQPKYMNGTKIKKEDSYHFNDFYRGSKNIIVGIKDIDNESDDDAMFMMMFDINGILPPNVWGKDIFGAKVFNDRVEPFGKGLSLDKLRNDCSKTGTGLGCSYYYTIGGNFVD